MSKFNLHLIKPASDCDEVLIPSTEQFVEFFNRVNGTNFRLEDVVDYHNFHESFEVTDEYMNDMWQAFYRDALFKHELYPAPDATKVVRWLTTECGRFLDVITSRPKYQTGQTTHRQLHSFFICCIGVIEHCDTHENDEHAQYRAKEDVFVNGGYNMFMEDTVHHLKHIAEASPEALIICFNKPWNLDFELPKHVKRVDRWMEIPKLMIEYSNILTKKHSVVK